AIRASAGAAGVKITPDHHAISCTLCMHGLSAEKKVCIVLITPLVNQPENVAGLVLDVVIRLFRR
ncbi:hypothetical protein, partial [Serratia marcescens]|uniref:hypothetical protein n=1 Tax=Serratia marcescens TaxID=615 RepID=UPI001A931FD7